MREFMRSVKYCFIGVSVCYCAKTIFEIWMEIADRIADKNAMKKEEERDNELKESCRHVYC